MIFSKVTNIIAVSSVILGLICQSTVATAYEEREYICSETMNFWADGSITFSNGECGVGNGTGPGLETDGGIYGGDSGLGCAFVDSGASGPGGSDFSISFGINDNVTIGNRTYQMTFEDDKIHYSHPDHSFSESVKARISLGRFNEHEKYLTVKRFKSRTSE